MGLGLGLGIWWPTQTSIIPGLLKALCARATYCENKTCTTATLEEIAAVRYTAPVLPIGLLADYPGASAAYSLRNLIDTTTNVVRVRRSSDNTEQDFTSAEITDGTLTTFTGANDGFVTTWYDQSGNVNNASQATASNQPKLVSNGVVILDNGKPCLDYDSAGSDNFNLATGLTSVRSTFSVISFGDESGNLTQFLYGDVNEYDYASGDNGLILGEFTLDSVKNGNNKINSVTSDFLTTTRTSTQCLVSMIHTSSNGSISKISKDRNVNYNRSLSGKLQEVIIYETDQTSNLEGINNNINTEYNIY